MKFPSLFLLLPALAAARPPAAQDFVLHPDCVMNLFAAEPDVVSPSALCFDAAGRCYVTEMLDYPLGTDGKGKPGGRVRLLLDADRDGRAEKSVLFAEGLSFPTGICAVRDGVIVASPPEIVFLADRDGDGQAEVREVWFSGFLRSVTDSNFSGLRFGPDGLIHGVNGGNGGLIFCPPLKRAFGKLENADFAFDPATLDFVLTYPTGGGFGLCFDEAGRSFVTHNINHLQMRILPQRVLDEVSGGTPLYGTRNVSVHGENCRIYPVAEAATRPNHPEQAGYFSAAGGVGCLAHRGWPEGLRGSLFTCDAASGIVHRELPQPDGPIVKTERAPGEQTREFLAGRDPSFRPVGAELGPDGALYILDMQRDIIEHPDYIPPKMRARIDLRAGADRGRIWRILPKAGLPADALPAADKLFTSPNQWTRLTDQRLLLENTAQRAASAAAVAEVLQRSRDATARFHALWTLHGLGSVPDAALVTALRDKEKTVRAAAAEIAGDHAQSAEIIQQLEASALEDPDAEVRWKCLQSLAATDSTFRASTAVRSLVKDGDNEWLRHAALRLAGNSAGGAIRLAIARRKTWSPQATGDFARASGGGESLTAVMELAASLSDDCLSAAADAAKKAGLTAPVPAAWLTSDRPALVDAALQFQREPAGAETAARILQQAANPALPAAVRARWLRILRHLPLKSAAADAVISALQAGGETPLQQAALECLRERTDSSVAARIIAAWRTTAPSLHPQLAALLIDRREFRAELADALESGAIAPGELNPDLEQRRTLLRHSSSSQQRKFAKFFTDDEYSNRRAVVDEWLAKLPATGDAAKGQTVFTKVCAQCHRAAGAGHEVGPDLTAQSHRSVEDLLTHILDPDMALNPNYANFIAETTGGTRHAGILVRSGAKILLRQAMGLEVELPRSEIKTLESTGKSLMPQGLESAMTPAELRDLIAFLQAGR